jgi:hypothetical protein
MAQAVGSIFVRERASESSASSRRRSLALMREKCRHFGLSRNLFPSGETAALK